MRPLRTLSIDQVAMQMAMSQTRQAEDYPLFSESDLDPEANLNSTNGTYGRQYAILVPHRKRVIVHRYKHKSVGGQSRRIPITEYYFLRTLGGISRS